jgi:hypothetical protein
MLDMQDRYEVRPLVNRFVIRDMQMRAFCSLDGKTVLKWETRHGAEAWLNRCYHYWGTNPAVGEEPPPQSLWLTRRYVEKTIGSPWGNWMTPVWDSRFGQ